MARLPQQSQSPLSTKTAKTASTDMPQSPKGSLNVTSYKLKKSTTRAHNFKCTHCGVIKSSVLLLNDHHRRRYGNVMCGVCNKLFNAPLQLACHMYEHEDKDFECSKCKQRFNFASELKKHKIVHRKNLSHQCMHAKCGRWFMREHDLNFHLKMHDKQSWTCTQCDKFTTTSEKYLKDHIKSNHSDELPYKCSKSDQLFKYRQQVKRHNASDHK